MRFGVDAARNGLWREAIFRWEKLLKAEPDNPRLRNNLAVAYEGLGEADSARREYREALRLAPGSREIRDNYVSFLELCKAFRGCQDEEDGAAATPPAPAPEAPAGATPSPSPAPPDPGAEAPEEPDAPSP